MNQAVVPDLRSPAPTVEISEVAPTTPGRLQSLDVFRGITIAGMLLVNNPGTWAHVYSPLRHAEWHGWTPTDLIFPFFLFVVGVAMTFSLGKEIARGAGRAAIFLKAAKRAGILFGLGLLLHAFPWWNLDIAQLRIPGVLQRIALAFVVASGLVLCLGPRGRAAATAALLLGYWAVMSWIPVPGVGAGVWEPGKDLGAYLDRLVFGTDHLWAQARTWDPEGLLSTLPAVATVLLGVFAGDWLRSRRTPDAKIRGMLLAGTAGMCLGLIWHQVFPINKPLWTSSYVLFAGGVGLICLALCYWSVDVRGHRRWSFPFVVLGVNAIATFFLSSLLARILALIPAGGGTLKGWLFDTLFAAWLAPIDASLAFALAYVLLWVAVMWALYRRGIFIKI